MAEPYYQDDSVTLYLGDCREVTEWLEADVLVTDPPYGISWSISENKEAGSKSHSGIANDADTLTRDLVLGSWWRSHGKPTAAAVFGSFRAKPPIGVVQTLVWKKPIDAGVVGSTTGYRTDVEPVYLIGTHLMRSAARSSVLESRSNKNSYMRLSPNAPGAMHPHAKPIAIIEQLIEWLPPGAIADPFAGSGPTLIAARNLGRKAIGVEIEERYCELIAKRLDQLAFDFGSGAPA